LAQLHFIISNLFSHPNFKIQISVLPDIQNSPKFAGQHFETEGATLLFGPTSKSLYIASYKFWIQFIFESSLNFRGVKAFLEKIR
jgi:hypothetical protein